MQKTDMRAVPGPFAVTVMVLLLLTIIINPVQSQARMRPLSEDIVISWSPEPEPLFEICWHRWHEDFLKKPWYDVVICPMPDIDTFVYEHDTHRYGMLASGLFFEYGQGSKPDVMALFFDELLRSFKYCDWDGLACRGDAFSGPKTEYGCIAVELEAEKAEFRGDVDVILPIQDGGSFRDSEGNPFIKISFPELVSATLTRIDLEIMLGQTPSVHPYETCPCNSKYCEDDAMKTPSERLSPAQTLGVLTISNMKVDIRPGGFVQMWVTKDDTDLSYFEKWRHN